VSIPSVRLKTKSITCKVVATIPHHWMMNLEVWCFVIQIWINQILSNETLQIIKNMDNPKCCKNTKPCKGQVCDASQTACPL